MSTRELRRIGYVYTYTLKYILIYYLSNITGVYVLKSGYKNVQKI